MQVSEEVATLGRITGAMIVMGLLLYLRGVVSTLFQGSLRDLELAGGSLSMSFINITGYSVISGLAMGMESICG